MRVTLQFRGQLALAVGGKPELEFDVEPGMPLRDLLEKIAASREEHFRELVFDAQGNCGSTLFVAIDDEHVRAPDAVIPEGAREIVIMPPIAGG